MLLGNPLVPTENAPTTDGPWPFPATPNTEEQRAAWEAQRIAKSNESAQKTKDRKLLEKEAAEARGYDEKWELSPPDIEELVKELDGEGLDEVKSLILRDEHLEDKLAMFQKWSEESHSEFESMMSPARDDLADIPMARSPGPEERGLSRFPEDTTYGAEDMSQVYIADDGSRVHIDGTPALS